MSPRSEEFMAMARDRLRIAQTALAESSPPSASSLAYYAMLCAARAALSEEDKNAKTHTGVWRLFRESFVATGRFDSRLFEAAQGTQSLREAVDYDARAVSRDEAEALLRRAEAFLAAIDAMLAGS